MESQNDSAQWENIIQATKPPIWYGIAVWKSLLNYSRKEKGQYLWVHLESKKKSFIVCKGKWSCSNYQVNLKLKNLDKFISI